MAYFLDNLHLADYGNGIYSCLYDGVGVHLVLILVSRPFEEYCICTLIGAKNVVNVDAVILNLAQKHCVS